MKLEYQKPKSFFRQLADALEREESVTVSLKDLPEAYQASPANLCHKLKNRAQLCVRYCLVGQVCIFTNQPEAK